MRSTQSRSCTVLIAPVRPLAVQSGLAREATASEAEVVRESIRDAAELAAIVLLVPLVARLDAHVLENGLSERSVTETVQVLAALVSAVCFAVAAKRSPQLAAVLVLASGLCATMLVRELDMYFDAIWHGFWVVPAGVVVATSAALAFRRRSSFVPAWARYSHTASYTYALLGLLVLLVFSRNFGSGAMWKPLLGDSTGAMVKTIVQEGIELLGYVLLARSAALAVRESSAARSVEFAVAPPRRTEPEVNSSTTVA
jgi:hypothetical protein